MAVQVETQFTNIPFLLGGDCLIEDDETFLQDAGRSGNIAKYTVCAKNSDGKWVPFTDETATDGTQVACGLVVPLLTEAEIKAGDVTGVSVIRRATIVDDAQIVVENSKTLDTLVTAEDRTVRDLLQIQGIYTGGTKYGVNFEN
jgi:hypothetical protein